MNDGQFVELSAKRGLMTYNRKRRLAYWLMLIPFAVGFVLVYSSIYVNSFRFSFQDVRLLAQGGFENPWNGFTNYRYILAEEPNYRNNLSLAVGEMMIFTLFITIFSLFIAVLLNRKMAGRGFFRAMFFIPVILATGFVARAEMYSMVMQSMQSGMEAEAATGSSSMFSVWDLRELMWRLRFSPMIADYVLWGVNQIVNIINGSGVQILIFLAGMQSISPAIYESADIDGASGWEKFWLITLPMISPLIIVNVIYTIIDSLTKPQNQIMLQIEEYRMRAANGMGIASAMAWFYFMVVILCLVGVTALISGYVYYQQRD